MTAGSAPAAIILAIFLAATALPASAEDLRGQSIMMSLAMRQHGSDMRWESDDYYYVTKDGKFVLSPYASQYYAPSSGVILGFEEEICDLVPYHFPYEGNTVMGKAYVCGQATRDGEMLHLRYTTKDDNGLGEIVQSQYDLVVSMPPGRPCSVSGGWTATSVYGATSGSIAGSCTLRPGRDRSKLP